MIRQPARHELLELVPKVAIKALSRPLANDPLQGNSRLQQPRHDAVEHLLVTGVAQNQTIVRIEQRDGFRAVLDGVMEASSGLLGPRLGLDLRGDVAPGSAIAREAPVLGEDRLAVDRIVVTPSVGAEKIVAEVAERPARPQIGGVPGPLLVVQVGAGEFPPRSADQVRGMEAGHLPEAVREIGKAEVLAHLPEPVGGRFRDVPEPLLASAKRPLGPLALGDVLHLDRIAVDRSARIAEHRQTGQGPEHLAGLVHMAPLVDRADRRAAHELLPVLRDLLEVIGKDRHVEGSADQLRCAITKELAVGPIDLHEATIRRHEGRAHGAFLEYAPEPLLVLPKRLLDAPAFAHVARRAEPAADLLRVVRSRFAVALARHLLAGAGSAIQALLKVFRAALAGRVRHACIPHRAPHRPPSPYLGRAAVKVGLTKPKKTRPGRCPQLGHPATGRGKNELGGKSGRRATRT